MCNLHKCVIVVILFVLLLMSSCLWRTFVFVMNTKLDYFYIPDKSANNFVILISSVMIVGRTDVLLSFDLVCYQVIVPGTTYRFTQN